MGGGAGSSGSCHNYSDGHTNEELVLDGLGMKWWQGRVFNSRSSVALVKQKSILMNHISVIK